MNRAHLLGNIKLCASSHHHMWIENGVTVRKRLNWILTSVTLTFDLWPRPFVWTSLWPMVITSWTFHDDITSTPIHARAWKEKALAGYNSQQIPTKNDIHKMMIIIISLRWKHFVIKSYLYKIPTNTHRYSHSLISPIDGSQLSFILSLKNCIRRTNL